VTATLTELRSPLTQEQVRQRILNGLLAAGFPTSDWAPTAQGGIENGLVDMVARTLVEKMGGAKLAAAIDSGFLDFAVGLWLDFWGQHFYGLTRAPASHTVQAITLTNAFGAGAHTVAAGDLVVMGAGTTEGANHYRSLEAAVIPDGAGVVPSVPPVVLRFQAENPGSSYDDAPDTIVTLVTSLAGVTAINRRILFPAPAAIVTGGGSRGQVVPSQTTPGEPPVQDRFRVEITASGNGSAAPLAQFRYSTDDGESWNGPYAASSAFLIPGGCTVAFQDSPTNPSFVVGDVFFWGNTSILEQGSNAETDERLVGRCRARWLTLSDVPSSGTVEIWAKLAAPEVARVRVYADPNTANRMLVYVGSSSGRAAPATVVAVQKYITDRLDPSEAANVLSVVARSIYPTGTVQVPRLQLADVQTAAEQLWTDYLASVDIAGTVRLAKLKQALKDAGATATDYSSLALTGGSPNIVLGDNHVPVPPDGQTLIDALTWEPI
jgi:Baseplate J-like protein